MSKRVILEFPDVETADDFCSWWSDGGGEYAYFEAYHDDATEIRRFDYSRCFPAHGYDLKKHGEDRVIVAQPKEKK